MINDKLLRFTVPFQLSNYAGLLSDDFSALQELGWEKKHIAENSEDDLYEYISKLMNENKDNDIASSWKLNKDLYVKATKNKALKENFATGINCKKENIQTEYNKEKEQWLCDKYYLWEITRVGLILFTSEVGLIWYEIDLQNTYKQQVLPNDGKYDRESLQQVESVDELIQFTYCSKEFSYLGKDMIMLNHYSNSKDDKGWNQVNLFEDILVPMIKPIDIDSYFANRKQKEKIIPDRGVLFSWVLDNEAVSQNANPLDAAFHLGRNYKDSYNMYSLIPKSDFYIPFEDSIWYAGLEGCANYVYPKDNKEFFTMTYGSRLNTYFYLYILCMGQYFTLLKVAHDVSVLPTADTMYSSRNSKLEQMLDKIHIFNLKNNYSQVGHLAQHNEFYEYLQNRLGINRMQQELEVELKSLYEMVDKKQKMRSSERYKILTIISSIFVIIQTFVNVATMYDSFISKEWERFGFGLLGILGAAVVAVVVLLFGKLNSYISDSSDRKHNKI